MGWHRLPACGAKQRQTLNRFPQQERSSPVLAGSLGAEAFELGLGEAAEGRIGRGVGEGGAEEGGRRIASFFPQEAEEQASARELAVVPPVGLDQAEEVVEVLLRRLPSLEGDVGSGSFHEEDQARLLVLPGSLEEEAVHRGQCPFRLRL